MSGLLMPRHVAAQRAAAAADAFSRRPVINAMDTDDFVSDEAVAEQLAQLAQLIADKRTENPDYQLPRPCGWKLQVLMLSMPKMTKGGLELPDEAIELRALASPQGVVLAVGSRAFKDPSRFANDDGVLEPWCTVGDRISFVKYDAGVFQLGNGQRLGTMNDTQPVSVIDSGWEVPS